MVCFLCIKINGPHIENSGEKMPNISSTLGIIAESFIRLLYHAMIWEQASPGHQHFAILLLNPFVKLKQLHIVWFLLFFPTLQLTIHNRFTATRANKNSRKMKMKIPQTFFSVVILFSHQISQTHNHLIVYRTITCKYAFLQEIKTKNDLHEDFWKPGT